MFEEVDVERESFRSFWGLIFNIGNQSINQTPIFHLQLLYLRSGVQIQKKKPSSE